MLIHTKFHTSFQQVFLSYDNILTLILAKQRVISLCHQYKARPACTSMQSDQALLLYCWLTNIDITKMKMDIAKNVRSIIPFKKYERLRVKNTGHLLLYFILNNIISQDKYIILSKDYLPFSLITEAYNFLCNFLAIFFP